MPLNVWITRNGEKVRSIHVGNLAGERDPDNIGTWSAVLEKSTDQFPITREEWEDGIHFSHRYGDGYEVCVLRALEALHEAKLI